MLLFQWSNTFLSAWSENASCPFCSPQRWFAAQLCGAGSTICIRHADSTIPDTTMNQRRYTYNKDVLWILDHLSQHGKILKLKLGFCGRRNVRMTSRDRDFLNALKGVKTDKLDFGNPGREDSSKYDVRFSQSMFPPSPLTVFILGNLVQSILTPKV